VLARAVPSSWQGRPVRRLPLDVQLAYIAASWFNDMVVFGFQPSFLPSLFDAAYLLRRHGAALDWSALRAGLDDDMARGCLYVLLTYLPRFGGVGAPAAFTDWLAGSQCTVGPLQLRLIHPYAGPPPPGRPALDAARAAPHAGPLQPAVPVAQARAGLRRQVPHDQRRSVAKRQRW
jgi:hypothetical protein